jgi:hypothetical protein
MQISRQYRRSFREWHEAVWVRWGLGEMIGVIFALWMCAMIAFAPIIGLGVFIGWLIWA